MGDEKIEYGGNYVIDFLYKDMALINSFYSQYFNGTLNSIVKKDLRYANENLMQQIFKTKIFKLLDKFLKKIVK